MKQKMADMAYRARAFKRVFATPEAKEVLAWLEAVYQVKPDFENVYLTFYRLGQQAVIDKIKEAILYERKEACQTMSKR